MQIFISSA